MPLHLDYRPGSLAEFLGNEGIKDSLFTVLNREDKPHTILFVGPSGCGKTTLARIAMNMIGCHEHSIKEFNSSNTRGIDTIRSIAEDAQYGPLSGKYKGYIIDECHKMTNDAQNAILKLLEDTPKHVFIILCTTDPEKMIKAIRTRCMTFEVKSLATPTLSKLVKDTVASEGITDFSDKVVSAIVKAADGCPRQALILLDSVIDIIDEEAALRAITESTASESASIEICRLLIENKKNKWSVMADLLKGLPDDAEKMRYGILGYMQSIILSDRSDSATIVRAVQINDCFMESFMYTGKPGLVNACYYACQVD